MRANLAALGLAIFLGVTLYAAAQNAPQSAPGVAQPGYSPVNCSGFITEQKVSDEMRLVSGEQSGYKAIFARGDYVHINRGQDKGVRIGDRFAVLRAQKDPLEVPWFKWQEKLLESMGNEYVDAGQLRVVNVQLRMSIAEVGVSFRDM